MSVAPLSLAARVRLADAAERALSDRQSALRTQLSALSADIRLLHPAVIVGAGFIAGLLLGRSKLPASTQLWTILGTALTRILRAL